MADATVCRHCLLVLDESTRRERDAGRIGGDGRDLPDPPIGPVPTTGSGLLGAATAGLRLVTTDRLLRRRRRQSDA
jgi:hypothetical protein